MRIYTAIIERCQDTGLFVGFIPGFPGAHTQGETLDELHQNLREVVEMLIEDGEPMLEAEFIGTQLTPPPATPPNPSYTPATTAPAASATAAPQPHPPPDSAGSPAPSGH
jgi:predicted RNase H-like HicB family nuclease